MQSIVVQPDGRILVGGWFTQFNGSSQIRIIRLNADGSKDTSFDIGSGFNNAVMSVALDANNRLLVGGYFTQFNGSGQNRLVRLNTNGSKDGSFDINGGFNNEVNTIAVQPNGRILVGGNFTQFNGSSQIRIIRLNADGSKDNSFHNTFGRAITVITLQSNGQVLVGGGFLNVGGVGGYIRLARLNSDGSLDTSFQTIFNSWVYSIVVQPDDKILVGGVFTSFNTSTQNRLIRLNPDGSKDTSFDIGSGFNAWTWGIALQSNGRILVGGDFTTFDGGSQSRLIRLLDSDNPCGVSDHETCLSLNITSGELTVSSPGSVSISGLSITREEQIVNVDIEDIILTDLRGSLAGYNLNISVSNLVNIDDGSGNPSNNNKDMILLADKTDLSEGGNRFLNINFPSNRLNKIEGQDSITAMNINNNPIFNNLTELGSQGQTAAMNMLSVPQGEGAGKYSLDINLELTIPAFGSYATSTAREEGFRISGGVYRGYLVFDLI